MGNNNGSGLVKGRLVLVIVNAVAAALVLLSATAPYLATLNVYSGGGKIDLLVGFLLYGKTDDWRSTGNSCDLVADCSTGMEALWLAAFIALALSGVLYILVAVFCYVKPCVALLISPFSFTLVGASFATLAVPLLQLRLGFNSAQAATTVNYDLEWAAYVSLVAIVVAFVASVMTIMMVPCACRCKDKQNRP